MKSKRKKIRVFAAIIIVIIAVIAVCAIYLNDYYHADDAAVSAFSPVNTVEIQSDESGNYVFAPEHADTGVIFYPGGKVEYTSYIPLMQQIASEGVLCVLVEMPFNLAVFDIDAAEGIQEQYPQIKDWYIGGHSLGGSMAASYLADHIDEFAGLILLGSYSTVDLSDTELKVISVYGSKDTVLDSVKYEENKVNLPVNYYEVVIEGGCHAYFGMYGEQKGDGKPEISSETQIAITAGAITEVIK